MANLFDTLNLGGAEGVVTLPYGVCFTAAATAAKTVTTTSKKFALATGATILVRFTTTNTATTPTLSVNDTDPKAIRYRGATAANHLAANRVYLFVYDGTDWELVGDINTDDTSNSETDYYLWMAVGQQEELYLHTSGHENQSRCEFGSNRNSLPVILDNVLITIQSNDTDYTTPRARGQTLHNSSVDPNYYGSIAWTYG